MSRNRAANSSTPLLSADYLDQGTPSAAREGVTDPSVSSDIENGGSGRNPSVSREDGTNPSVSLNVENADIDTSPFMSLNAKERRYCIIISSIVLVISVFLLVLFVCSLFIASLDASSITPAFAAYLTVVTAVFGAVVSVYINRRKEAQTEKFRMEERAKERVQEAQTEKLRMEERENTRRQQVEAENLRLEERDNERRTRVLNDLLSRIQYEIGRKPVRCGLKLMQMQYKGGEGSSLSLPELDMGEDKSFTHGDLKALFKNFKATRAGTGNANADATLTRYIIQTSAFIANTYSDVKTLKLDESEQKMVSSRMHIVACFYENSFFHAHYKTIEEHIGENRLKIAGQFFRNCSTGQPLNEEIKDISLDTSTNDS